LVNPSAVSRTGLGMTMTGLFGLTTKQMPNLEGPWGGMFPDVAEMNLDGPFNGSGFGATKQDPSVYDNFTKVIGLHTIKLGAYWDENENIQSSSAFATGANGTFELNWGSVSTGNTVADFEIGHIAEYQQPSGDIVNTIQDHQWSIYAQDSFKANRQLTVNYGLRFDHVGQWYGNDSEGMAVWNPATYTNNPKVNNPGYQYHSIANNIPLSGFKSPLFYYEPRVGLAYDIFGNGKTVVRGGFAAFRYQLAVNDVGGAYNLPSGIYTANVFNMNSYATINTATTGAAPTANGTSISVMQMGDNRTPYTNDWNLSVGQALPGRSVFELSYVGNASRNELINGANGKIDDLNAVQPGGEWFVDPKTTGGLNNGPIYVSPGNLTCNNTTTVGLNYVNCGAIGPNGVPLSTNYKASFTSTDYMPLTNYQNIYLVTHGSYANYNSLQASWKKQSGPVSYILNYTYGKVMGIWDGQSDNGPTNGTTVNPFNLRSNYGPLAYDHSQIVNASYVWNMPKFVHGNHLLETGVNGWQLSGYTTYQAGQPLQPNAILNFTWPSGLSTPIAALAGSPYQVPDNTLPLPNGLRSNAVNAGTFYGTDQNGGGYENFLPQITCDPRSGRSAHQYFNPNCFAVPPLGQLGTLQWPYLHAPAYFDWDLGLYKSFAITESKRIEFRATATNWLNHPLYQFGLAGTGDEMINLQQQTTEQIPATALNGAGQNICSALGATPSGGTCSYTYNSIAATNTNATTTGKPGFKTGQRSMLFSAKFYF
jgi:hypothetical protein